MDADSELGFWLITGMHKRFRMIALTQHMRQRGHFAEHTRAMGIRVKLDGLYNIKALDERVWHSIQR